MSISFRVGKYIDPSGFGMAVVDIPEIDPEKNISLVDYSHTWEENVASSDRSVLQSTVDNGGHMPGMTITEFLVTNVAMSEGNDVSVAPLYYRHKCRFYHFTYGETPERQVYITDSEGNTIKKINYLVKVERILKNVYLVDVLTDFHNNESVVYKVKYNRCNSSGGEIFPGWEETLNAEPLFKFGSPFSYNDEYSIWGPDEYGLYSAIVPPVPTLSGVVNAIGISFENAPTIVQPSVTNNVSQYADGVIVKYTLKATSPSTFSIRRNFTRMGVASTDYLQSATTDTWSASEYNFSLDTHILGLYGIDLWVHGDNYLITGDEAYFTAKKSFYYLMPTAYSAIYATKPKHVIQTDDWYVRVKNGAFRRRMNTDGESVPSGYAGSTLFEYRVPEYDYQMWDTVSGPPYKLSSGERVELLDKQTIQLQRTPMFIDQDEIITNIDASGFPPSGYLQIYVNDSPVPATGILDWDIYNGTVRLAQLLTHRDDIIATYIYKEEYVDYKGFVGSGGLYPVDPPYPYLQLDLNPTPVHNYDMYASGTVASIFLKPYAVIDDGPGGYGQPTVICNESLYHTKSGVPSGVYDFKIASVSLGPHCKMLDLSITDVRTRGGGLSRLGIESLERVKGVQPESEFFWDVGYFDGQAVPANGVIVVKIPKSVLIQNGGQFGEDEVRQKVQKHAALGSYPIIQYI